MRKNRLSVDLLSTYADSVRMDVCISKHVKISASASKNHIKKQETV